VSVLDDLIQLEIELHQLRNLPWELANRLLHDNFTEIGRSGTLHTKASVLESIPGEGPSSEYTVSASGFEIKHQTPASVLLCYKSVQHWPGGITRNHALRSSLWVAGATGWVLLFHQGTPFSQSD
jgi:hypothetical protein